MVIKKQQFFLIFNIMLKITQLIHFNIREIIDNNLQILWLFILFRIFCVASFDKFVNNLHSNFVSFQERNVGYNV